MTPAAPHAAAKRTIPFDILESIRGIAALYVAVAHCRGVLWAGGREYTRQVPPGTWGLAEYATFGSSMLTRLAVEFVIVFFVLSGFCIAHSLSGSTSPASFYKRRLIRIYPSYAVALLWAGLVYLLTRWLHPAWYDGSLTTFAFARTVEMRDYLTAPVMLKNLVYLPSQGFITPFWSLTYEIIFYALAPWLLRRVHAAAGVAAALFVLNLTAPERVAALGLPAYVHGFLFTYGLYFAAGAVLYQHLDAARTRVACLTRRDWMLAVAGLLGAMYAANLAAGGETAASFMAAAALSACLILLFLRYSIRIGWLMAVGRLSYTLYITHLASVYLYLAAYWLIARPQVPYIMNYFVWMPAVGFVTLVAAAQYQLVEKRSRNVLSALRGRAAARGLRPFPVES